MKHEKRTKEQLIEELAEMGHRIAELEASETQRQRAEEALRESEEFSSTLLNGSPNAIVVINPDTSIRYANPAFEELTGFLSAEVIDTKAPYPWWTERTLHKTKGDFQRVMSEGVRRVEELFEKKNGERFWVEISSTPIRRSGQLKYYLSNWVDITERKRTEEALKESEEFSSGLLANSRNPVVGINPGTSISYVNPALEELTGFSRAELIGRKAPYPWWTEEMFEKTAEVLREAMAKGAEGVELLFQKKDGVRFWVELSSAPVRLGGKLKYYLSNWVDITERKRAEEELKESEERFRTASQITSDVVYERDLQSGIATFYGDIDTKLGYDPGEYPRTLEGWREHVHPEDLAQLERKTVGQFQPGVPYTLEYRMKKKDGTYMTWSDRFIIIWDEGIGRPLRAVGAATDITERRLAEKALKESEERYRALFENSIEGVFTVDLAGNFTSCNKAVAELYGYTTEELLGSSYKTVVAPGDAERIFQEYNELFRTGEPIRNLVYELITKNGERRLAEGYANVIREGDRIVGFQGTLRDITERKRVEEQLVRLSNAVRMSTDSIVISDLEGKILEANEATLRMYGTDDRRDLIGKGTLDLVVPEDREKALAAAKEALSEGYVKGLEYHVVTKEGDRIPMETSVAVMKDARGNPTGIVAVSRDISERKGAEEEIHRLGQYLRSVIDNTDVVLDVIDREGNVLLWNKAAEVISGYSREEVVGHNKVWNWLYPDREQRRAIFARAAAVMDGEMLEDSQWTIRTKGGEDRTLSFYATKLVDEKGNPIGSAWLGTDITTRKRAEQEKRELEQRAQLASRLSTVGEMASGIAHEINNPLTTVIGFAQLLMGKHIPEDIREDVKIINDSAQRVASIVKRLLSFARQQKPERVYADVNDIIETTLAMRAYAMETSNIKVVTQLDPQLPQTMADASQLQQVFLNIILNAETEIKLAHGRGKLFVKTATVDNTIQIRFRDDGPGIAKENLERLFDPFFTTREVGWGTGLGLSICHAIVNEHGGQIYAKSNLGEGATFIVELPIIAEERQAELPEPAAEDHKQVRRARILVVDDEPATLELLRQMLTAEGHEVQTADNGADALDRIKSERYSLILLDVKLPGMGGVELYTRVENIAQSLARRIVFMTGDVMGVRTKDFLSKTNVPHMAKPFDIEQLRNVIEQTLARSV